MVVRTINSSAFTQHDWDEYVVTVRAFSSSLTNPSQRPLTNRDHTTTTPNPKHHGTGLDHGEPANDLDVNTTS
jgi:hypothetical protein